MIFQQPKCTDLSIGKPLQDMNIIKDSGEETVRSLTAVTQILRPLYFGSPEAAKDSLKQLRANVSISMMFVSALEYYLQQDGSSSKYDLDVGQFLQKALPASWIGNFF